MDSSFLSLSYFTSKYAHHPTRKTLSLDSYPIQIFGQTCPFFMDTIVFSSIIVAVCCFLYGKVIPDIFILVVRPYKHSVKQVICGFRLTIQITVDQCHDFGAGNIIIGTEQSIVPFYPVDGCRCVNITLRPMSVDIREEIASN